ncbi:MAG: oligosaccharide repeat unit polymerase [FCB group bacterium]|nr:oligosaccharide repeat unit polymerase [FCB group bacterium]MBL7028476.1 oligosaccharide repeat unit polymerase [Candidatus Neomarinimicrobiota bacterium]MBL7121540.1 oligosaccharide repeat unit polymerase [Candidatus Neomarinimicrobiota bacterium]
MARLTLANAPILAFTLVWSTLFSLYSFNWFNYHRADDRSLMILISGILAVYAGYFLVSLIFRKNTVFNESLPDHYGEGLFNKKILYKITFITVILYLLGGTAFFYVFSQVVGGAKYYFIDPGYVRDMTVAVGQGEIANVPIVYRFAGFFISVGVLSNLFGGALFATDRTKKILAFLPLVSNVFVSFANLQRYLFLMGIVFWILSFMYTTLAFQRKDNAAVFRSMLKTVLILGLIFYGFNYFIVHMRAFDRGDLRTFFYESLYAYFVGSVSSFDMWLNDPNHHINYTYGQAIFRDVFRYLSKLGIWDTSEVRSMHPDFVLIGKNMGINTYTFVRVMYEDFQIVGVLLFSFIWGGTAKYSVIKYFEKPNYTNLYFVLLMTLSLLMSFFSFYFRNIAGPVFLLLATIVIQAIIKKTRQPNIAE